MPNDSRGHLRLRLVSQTRLTPGSGVVSRIVMEDSWSVTCASGCHSCLPSPLDNRQEAGDSIVERRGEDGAVYGFIAGHAGHVDLEDARAGAGARVGDCAEDPGDVEQRFADRPGFALPGSAQAGISRMDSRNVGRIGEQPARAVLCADGGWPETAGCGTEELGSADGRGEPGAAGRI